MNIPNVQILVSKAPSLTQERRISWRDGVETGKI